MKDIDEIIGIIDGMSARTPMRMDELTQVRLVKAQIQAMGVIADALERIADTLAQTEKRIGNECF